MSSRLRTASGGASKLARPVPLGTGMKSPLGRGIARPSPPEGEGSSMPRTPPTGGEQKRPPPQVRIIT